MKPAVLLVAAALAAQGQPFTQRGFFENRNFLYFQDAPNDSANYVGEAMLRQRGTLGAQRADQGFGEGLVAGQVEHDRLHATSSSSKMAGRPFT